MEFELTTLSRDCDADPSLPHNYALRVEVARVLRCLGECCLVYVAPGPPTGPTRVTGPQIAGVLPRT